MLESQYFFELGAHSKFQLLLGEKQRAQIEERKREEQAGAELCQAQFKLGQAKIEIFYNIIEIEICLPFKNN